MVFFTCILIICILYYLQADGLVYSVIIALVAELINIFLTHTITKTIENKMKLKNRKAVEGYIKRIKANKKTISELEGLQEKAVEKIYKANTRIKELEEELEEIQTEMENMAQNPESVPVVPAKGATPARGGAPAKGKESKDYVNHLPDGSKKRPARP